MEAALRKHGIGAKTYRGKELIDGMWAEFKGFKAEPFARALESALKKHPNFFPTPMQVSACMDLIAPPVPKKAAPAREEPEPTREEYEKAIEFFEANGLKGLAAGCRRRLEKR